MSRPNSHRLTNSPMTRSCIRSVAVAQKSPCEAIRVLMGKESPLKFSQRGQDARAEVPMRTPKRLYADERIIYQPELLTCLHCGDLLGDFLKSFYLFNP